MVAVNCWSVTMASRTQVTLTFIKTFALVLIIVPGVIALAKGLKMLLFLLRIQMFSSCLVLSDNPLLFLHLLLPGKTENFQNGFEVDSLTLDRLPLAFYNGLYAYGGW